MATMEDAKIFEYCENLFDKLKERDGGYYPSKHDLYAIEETAKHFSISIEEVNRIFHEFTKQTAEIEMAKINKLPPALRKKVMMERGANILRENKDLPFCEKEGPPTIPFQSHASIFYQEYEPIAINVAKLGWTIPLNIDIKHLYDLKQIPLEENAIDNFFVDYYNGKELKLICRKISKAIQTYNVGQKEIFDECLEAYNAKLYSTCLTTLITILEGFISSFGDDPLDVRMKRICKYHEQEEYKNQMYQNILTTIVNDTTLSNNTINFANMDNKQRADFGTRLFQKLSQRYGEKNHTKLKFEIKDIESGQKSGGYDWKNTISIAPSEATDFTNFILIFAHEFSHYVYIKQPQKAPLTVQQINIAKKHYYSPPSISNKKAFERYKNQPFELPSYKLMDYFTEHNFIEKLATAIRTKQNNFSRDTI